MTRPSPTLSCLPALLLGALALCSCRLIDQRTFAPAPEAKTATAAMAATEAGPALDSRRALMVIEPGTRLDNYGGVLHDAVAAAMRRDPQVRFDVVTIVPGGTSLSAQVTSASAAQSEGLAVANALLEAGAPSGQVVLGARPDPRATHPEIRVYIQ